MNFCKSILYLGLVLWLCPSCRTESTFEPDHYVRLLQEPMLQKHADGTQALQLQFEVADGYHIMTNEETEENFIATTLSLKSNENIQFGEPQFSAPRAHYLQGLAQPIMVYEGVFSVSIPFTAKEEIVPNLEGSLYYQACDERKCFFPKKLLLLARL